jgi:hypothetical protein
MRSSLPYSPIVSLTLLYPLQADDEIFAVPCTTVSKVPSGGVPRARPDLVVPRAA